MDGFFRDFAFDLREVGPRVLEFWVEELLDELAVVREQQSAFAVMVEAARGVDSGREPELVERCVARFGGELAQDAEGLVEQDYGGH